MTEVDHLNELLIDIIKDVCYLESDGSLKIKYYCGCVVFGDHPNNYCQWSNKVKRKSFDKWIELLIRKKLKNVHNGSPKRWIIQNVK